jgi:cell division protein FtsA
VALVDIGGGTTDLAIFKGKNIIHTFVLALGGDNFTNDIAIGLRAPIAEAARIKEKFGCCIAQNIGPEEMLEVPGLGGRPPRRLPRQILGEIIEPRMEEIFRLVQREIDGRELSHCLNAGMVLTGGGSLVEGSNEVAESVFNVPARIGKPAGVTGLTDMINNPIYATGVGLVLFGAGQSPKKAGFRIRDKNIFKKVMAQMKRWFKDVI